MDSDFAKELKRVSGLKQNQGKTEEELYPQARINLECRKFKANPLFPDAEEQKLAEEKFKDYLLNNEIETSSDLDTLRSLIFTEILEG